MCRRVDVNNVWLLNYRAQENFRSEKALKQENKRQLNQIMLGVS
jgi:hypothetical protein